MTAKIVIPVVVAVLAALLIALFTGAAGKVKDWLFPTKVTVSGRVVVGGQPADGVQLALDGHPVDPTDAQGEFVLQGVTKGDHTLVLRKVGTAPRKPYTFSVGESDKKLDPIVLDPLVFVRFVFDQGQPGPTVHYDAYAWLLGRQQALKRVKSVLYELPVWVGKPPAKGAPKQPFCHAVSGDVDFGFLGQHSADPVVATVTLRTGKRFKVAGFPNLPGPAHPDCGPTSPPPPQPPPPQPPPPQPPPPPGPRTVPDVVGQSFESAASELQSFGFRVVRTDVESDEPEGVVVSQRPEGGTSQRPGATITVSVSKGATTLVTVPDVTDHTQADATVKLQDNKFKVLVVARGVSDPSEDGIVLDQDPPGGTQAASGATVTIVVGKLSP
ncbi:MAG TPA: PASTA domain-containing protein [Gaiellaceae bacterium]|nr:PASTA domain-containing protein [Gaiellaceae bacterium]